MSQINRFDNYAHFQFKRDTLENWMNNNPILKAGEPSYVTNSSDALHKLKIGDGVTAWKDLSFIPGDIEGGGGGGSIDPAILNSKMDKFGEVIQNGIETVLLIPDTGPANFKFTIKGEGAGGNFVFESNNSGGSISYGGPGDLSFPNAYFPQPTKPSQAANKQYVDNLVGDIETALDNIIEIQNSLIGGEVV